jgi:hypothetical protein
MITLVVNAVNRIAKGNPMLLFTWIIRDGRTGYRLGNVYAASEYAACEQAVAIWPGKIPVAVPE